MSVTSLRTKLIASLVSLGSIPADSDVVTDLAVAMKFAGTELLLSAGALVDRAGDVEERRVSKMQVFLAKNALAHAAEAIAKFEQELK